MLAGCVQWDYAVTDDGTSSAASASITVLMPAPLPPCTAQATFDDADAGPGSTDSVEVPCGAQTWTLGLDRATMTVYVKEDPAGLSWTPPCQ